MQGKVWLVGAGPSDPELLTIKGKRVLESAEVVVYDRLVGAGILRMIPPHATAIDVGKRSGEHPVQQDEINRILLHHAKLGKRVVRLKGGDPFLFGRGGEELELLCEHQIPFEIVPGITSALSVPAYAGIPVTHRDFCSSLHLITAHKKRGCNEPLDYPTLVKLDGTLVFLMGLSSLTQICKGLQQAGMSKDTPAAVLERGTTAYQRRIVSTLEHLPAKTQEQEISSPAIIIVGAVCTLSDSFHWVEDCLLGGARVVVTRPKASSSRLSKQLREFGAEVIELPVIETTALPDLSKLSQAMKSLFYDWIAFVSPTSVDIFFDTLKKERIDLRSISKLKFAAIGEATANKMLEYGIFADVVPPQYNGAQFVETLANEVASTERLLFLRAQDTPPDITNACEQRAINWEQLPVYQTTLRPAPFYTFDSRDIIAFTSASTVRGFVNATNLSDYANVHAICIGNQTAIEAKRFGMTPIISEESTLDSLTKAIVSFHQAQT